MNELLCKIFGHKWHSKWAGAKSSYFGAVVIHISTCNRCGEQKHEYTTHLKELEWRDKEVERG